jgi:hypothetical protein
VRAYPLQRRPSTSHRRSKYSEKPPGPPHKSTKARS